MRLPIASDETCTVYRKDNREILNTDIVNDLIVRALQKRRIDRHNRLHPTRSKSRRKCHRVFFRKRFSPVPSGIAAVIATNFGSRAPILHITVEKTSV